MNADSAQLGVLAAGGVLIGVPVVRGLRDTGSLPSMHRLATPLVVVGGAALLSQVAPLAGVALAWLAVLGLLLSQQAKKPPTSIRPGSGRAPIGPVGPVGGSVPRAPH